MKKFYYVRTLVLILAWMFYLGLSIHRKRYAVHHNDVAEPSFADAINIILP